MFYTCKRVASLLFGLLATALLFSNCDRNKGSNPHSSDDKEKLPLTSFNPLAYFAEYNMQDLKGTFETMHETHRSIPKWPATSPLEKTHLFKWSESLDATTGGAYEAYAMGRKIKNDTWYLPTWYEWQAIIPTDIIDFLGDGSEATLEEVRVAVAYKDQTGAPNMEEVEGAKSHTNYTMSGKFWSGNPCYAALLYKEDGTGKEHHLIAKYAWTKNASFSGLKIDMAEVKTALNSKEEVEKDAVWSNKETVFTRLFPAAGYYVTGALYDNGGDGNYWSATASKEGDKGLIHHVNFYDSNAYSVDTNQSTQAFSVRLIKRVW